MDPLYSARGTQFFAITPGSNIVGPTQSTMSDGRPVNYCNGFICDADAVLAIVGVHGDSAAAAVTIAVLKGVPYHFACRHIAVASGSTPGIVGWL